VNYIPSQHPLSLLGSVELVPRIKQGEIAEDWQGLRLRLLDILADDWLFSPRGCLAD
jgi:hypothetical protein